MDHLERLEAQSVYILREAYKEFKNGLAMLWSIGKDSTVLLWLARKAFFGHCPIPLVHIDTSFKVPEMIQYRDRLAKEWNLNIIYGANEQKLEAGEFFPQQSVIDEMLVPHGKPSLVHRGDAPVYRRDPNVQIDRTTCCKFLKTLALKHTLSGEWPRYRLNHATGKYEREQNSEPYTGVIVGARADEEGSRSKERYFSPRDKENEWDVGDQPPEFWNQFKTDFAPGTHVRIHPLLDWTELNIWEYL
ncbi:MAG: phosphoadenosine phosphosulfate reductase family protein, partial [Candidatus Sumerlaeaceae bacterium]|nr:phosphoadenosine phosphosulfate reductase family protein [Candidatus Sumerlaeaceae bacterium]